MRTFFECLLLCSLVGSGCGKKETSLYIDSDTNVLTFESVGGNQTIPVSSNKDWTVVSGEDWCRVLPQSGSGNLTVTVTVAENESLKERNTILIFISEAKTVKVNVTQEAQGEFPYIELKTNISPDERKTLLTCICGAETAKIDNLQEATKDDAGDWVLINGVRWATRNVGTPGTFVANPEDYGEYYQWNRGTSDFLLNDDYHTNATSWLPANDPSPAGYRVPTSLQIQRLVNTTYVTNEWTTYNGVYGKKFTDKTSNKSIFLPAAGWRNNNDSAPGGVGLNGYYWIGRQYGSNHPNAACGLHFSDAGWNSYYGYNRNYGFSIRPVADY